ncbi:MAG: Smr/MutS family protein [Paracoccaceae bacterium]
MTGRGRRRGLRPEDRAIWERVARTLTPLRSPSSRHAGPVSEPHRPTAPATDPLPDPPRPVSEQSLPSRVVKPIGRPVPGLGWQLTGGSDRPDPVGRPEPGLDRRTAERLRRGERPPDARLDLHGLTAERAHRRLDAFIGQAIRQGHRCVLVITGKGGRKPRDELDYMAPDRGVLRQTVPRWLRSGPYAGRIVGIFEAHQRHGGAGALYVYLKKGR